MTDAEQSHSSIELTKAEEELKHVNDEEEEKLFEEDVHDNGLSGKVLPVEGQNESFLFDTEGKPD